MLGVRPSRSAMPIPFGIMRVLARSRSGARRINRQPDCDMLPYRSKNERATWQMLPKDAATLAKLLAQSASGQKLLEAVTQRAPSNKVGPTVTVPSMSTRMKGAFNSGSLPMATVTDSKHITPSKYGQFRQPPRASCNPRRLPRPRPQIDQHVNLPKPRPLFSAGRGQTSALNHNQPVKSISPPLSLPSNVFVRGFIKCEHSRTIYGASAPQDPLPVRPTSRPPDCVPCFSTGRSPA